MEDLLYYMRRAEEQHLDLDLGEVKQYFPVNLVMSGIFKIFQDLFGTAVYFNFFCSVQNFLMNKIGYLLFR